MDHYRGIARLLDKGYMQAYEIDYKGTFALVSKMNTLRILISLTINLDQNMYQYDIKNAFLNGELEEDIYIYIYVCVCVCVCVCANTTW